MLVRGRADANGTDRQTNVADTPTMKRVKRMLAANRRTEAGLESAIVDAIAAGDKQIDVARTIGRSREYVRLLVEADRKRREG